MSITQHHHELTTRLQNMDDYDFEYFVADLWERFGWSTEVTSASNDAGIDVVAVREAVYREKALIQAKRYGPNTTIGSPAIQQYASLRNHDHDIDLVIVVTTNEFTSQARKMADRLNVKLVDGDDLITLIEQVNAYDLIDKYVPGDMTSTKSDPETTVAPAIDSDPAIGQAKEKKNNLVFVAIEVLISLTVHTAFFVGKYLRRVAHPLILLDRIDALINKFVSSVGKVETPTFSTRGWWIMVLSLSILLLGILSGTSEMIVLGWLVVPIVHWYDGRTWTRWWWAYAVFALIPIAGVLTAGMHLWRRHEVLEEVE